MDEEQWWNSSEIKDSTFSFDDDDLLISSDNVNDDFALSSQDTEKIPKVDIYSLVPETSIKYILNNNKPIESTTFTPQQNNNIIADLEALCEGKTVFLEVYKSLESKKSLLSYSIKKNNNSAILQVILFLVNTLKPSLIHEIFLTESHVFDIYIQYLISKNDIKQSIELYDILGFTKEAGMLQYSTCCINKINQLNIIKILINSYFLLDNEKNYLDNHLKLLEIQNILKLSNTSSVKECLAYCLKSNNTLGNITPQVICKSFNISNLLYHWIFLKEKSNLKLWTDINNLFISKKWHGTKAIITDIPVDDIVRILSENGAPEYEIKHYLQLLPSINHKLALAKKYKCIHTVVDILVEQKDRQALLEFKKQLTQQSESYFYAENGLRNSNVKWKN